MPFDYSIHDPRYDDASPIYCPGFKLSPEGTHSDKEKIKIKKINKEMSISHLCNITNI